MQNLPPQLVAKILFFEYNEYYYAGNYNIVYNNNKEKSDEFYSVTRSVNININNNSSNGITNGNGSSYGSGNSYGYVNGSKSSVGSTNASLNGSFNPVSIVGGSNSGSFNETPGRSITSSGEKHGNNNNINNVSSDSDNQHIYIVHFDRQNYAYKLLIKHSLVCRRWKDGVINLIPINRITITDTHGLRLLLSFINRINKLPQLTDLNFVVSEQLKGANPTQHSLYNQHWIASGAGSNNASVGATSISSYQIYNNTSMSHVFPTFPPSSGAFSPGAQNAGSANLSTGKRLSMALINLLPKELDVLRKEELDRLLKGGLLIKKLRLTHDSWRAYYPLIVSTTLVVWPLETLDLSGNALNDSVVINILHNLSSLRSLHLRTLNLSHNQLSNNVVLTLAKLIKTFHAPNNINLSHNMITSDPIKPLLESMRSATSPFSIKLANNRITDLGGVLFCRYLQTNSNLVALSLANNNLTLETSILLSDALKSQSGASLKSLKMSQIAMGQEEMKALESALRSPSCKLSKLQMAACATAGMSGASLAQAAALSTSLVTLDLRFNMIAPSGAIALATSLADNAILQSLNIGCCFLGQDFGMKLGASLQRNKTLTKLWVNDNAIGADGFMAVAEGLASNSSCQLRLLDLSANCSAHETLGLPAVSKLADALASPGSTLADLKLARNRLGHESLGLLAAALHTNTALENLNVSGNYIRGEGALALRVALETNRTLKVLTMNGSGLLVDGVKAMLQMLLQQAQSGCRLYALHMDNNLQDDMETVEIEPMLQKVLKENKGILELDVLPHILERRSHPYTKQRHYYKTKKYLLRLYERKILTKEKLFEQFSSLLKV